MRGKRGLTVAVLLGLGVLYMFQPEVSAEAAPVQLPVAEVVYENMDEGTVDEAKYLLPELKNPIINVEKLSKQIMMAREAGAVQFSAEFRPQADGSYKAVITSERSENEAVTFRSEQYRQSVYR